MTVATARDEAVTPPSPISTQVPQHARFPLLDAVRALAALSVFAFHVSIEYSLHGTAADFTRTLAIGVPVFFVVSGFLLYRPFVLAHLGERPMPRPGAYAWRRVLRLVPAFWVALTAALIVHPDGTRLADLPLLYGFAQVYDPGLILGGLSQAWTLACEVVYYAMIPLVALVVVALPARGYRQRMQAQLGGLVALLALGAAYMAWGLSWGDQADARGQVFTFHPGWYLLTFVAGMALAVWIAHRESAGGETALERLIGRRPGLVWILAAALYAAISLRSSSFFSDSGIVELYAMRVLFAVCVVLPAITGDARTGFVRRRILGNRALLWVGVVSYGFYLWHLGVVQVVMRNHTVLDDLPGGISDVVTIALALAGALAIAALSWVYVERPALGLRNRVGGRSPQRRGRPRGGRRAGYAVAAAVALTAILFVPGAISRSHVGLRDAGPTFQRALRFSTGLARVEIDRSVPFRRTTLALPGGTIEPVRCWRLLRNRYRYLCIAVTPELNKVPVAWWADAVGEEPTHPLFYDHDEKTLPNP